MATKRARASCARAHLLAHDAAVNHDRRETREQDGFEAGLLVQARPQHVRRRGPRLPQREEHEGDRHTCSQGEHECRTERGCARAAEQVECERVGELGEKGGPGSLGLNLGDVSGAPNPVRKPIVSLRHHWAEHAALSLADARIAEKVVRVHAGELVEDELDARLIPARVG